MRGISVSSFRNERSRSSRLPCAPSCDTKRTCLLRLDIPPAAHVVDPHNSAQSSARVEDKLFQFKLLSVRITLRERQLKFSHKFWCDGQKGVPHRLEVPID